MTRADEPGTTRVRTHLQREETWLAAILLTAVALRLYHIDQPLIDAFSWRQSSTAMIAENFFRTRANVFFPEVNWTGPGPNYQGREFQTITWLAAALYAFFGQHDWIGRMLAVLFSTWGVYALYRLVRLVWDGRSALAAAAVMAVLPGSVFVGRSFLPDPVMVSLVTTTLWLFVAWLVSGRSAPLVLAAIIGAWGFLTKIPGLIVGLPMLYAVLVLLGWRRALEPRRVAGLVTFAGITLGSVAVYYLWARHLALTYPPHHFAGAGNWVWDAGFTEWVRARFFLPKLLHHANIWLLTPPFALLFITGAVLPPPRATRSDAAAPPAARWFFHWWLAAGIVYYLIAASELVGNPWNLHILTPAVAALAGHAIIQAGGVLTARVGRRTAYIAAAVLLLLAAAYTPYALRWMYHPYARDGMLLGGEVGRVVPDDALVISLADDLGDPVLLYYARRRGWVFPPARPNAAWGTLPADDVVSIQLLHELRSEGAAWIAVVRSQWERLETTHPTLLNAMITSCEEILVFESGRVCRLAHREEQRG